MYSSNNSSFCSYRRTTKIMNPLTQTERQELEQLRLYKIENESKARVKAFARLEQLMDSSHDSMISVRAFRVICDCLLSLNESIKNE